MTPGSKKVLLDTNFLLIPAQFGVDIFSEMERIIAVPFTLHVLKATIDEAGRIIRQQRGKDKAAAKIAIQLVKAKNIGIIPSDQSYADKAIIDLVENDPDEWIVATQDAGLTSELRSRNIPIITLRKKKHLIMIE
ncbi:nucleotide-binding protein [Candidatus Woesearchaeota archaeon]|nr:nucleotide-binding protein [Candidatus Woesearchaeota archaeon]